MEMDEGEVLYKQITLAAEWIANSKHLVIFTGAGVSTESGLPDFRGPEGVWTLREKGLKPKLPKKPWSEVDPNAAHLAIVELQNLRLMKFLISQNIDNIHLKSGINSDLIAELHGNTTLMRCLNCNGQFTYEELGWDKEKFGRGVRTSPVIENQPTCPNCNGRIISSVVNFGDPLPEKELSTSFYHSERSDVFLVIGSSLVVTPAADMPRVALNHGSKLIIINKGETGMDDVANLCIEGKAGEILPLIVAEIRQKLISD